VSRAALGTIAALAAIVLGCGSSAPTASPSGSVTSLAPVSPATPSSSSPSSPSLSGSPSSPSSSATAGGSGQPAAPDPGLFAIIGGDADRGLIFQYDPDTTARVAADRGLAADATALAIGLYTIAGQDPVEDYAIVSIVRLRDATPDEAWFRAYRDSYDSSACAAAGGVARHAEAEIANRTVFIAGCAGGAFTYHIFLPAQGAVVSITAVGPGRLGERLANDIEN